MNKRLTIGIFNDVFFPMTDGVVMVVDNYARRLLNYADVIVFVPETLDGDFDDSVFPYKVVRCKSLSIPFLDYSLPTPKLDKNFINEIKHYSLDLVHIHSPFTLGQLGVKYAKKYHIPCVGTMHSQYKQDFEKAVSSKALAELLTSKIIKIFNECDECWAVNSAIAELYYNDYHYKTLPKVMENATEMKPIKAPKKSNNLINKKHHLKNDEKVFLFVGRINTLKNILFIVDSLKAVKYKAPKLKFKMLFVGTGQDEDKLVSHIKELSLENDVILCGKVSDRYELECYYKRADLFLFPSVYDASSIVQIEAACQETPGLFLKGTATASTITDNINGFLSENTVGAYSDRIIEIMRDKYLYDKVSKNAYIDLYKNWDDKIKEVYNEYLRIIENYK